MWIIFKFFTEFITILLLFYVLVFWLRGVYDPSPQSEIKPAPSALEGGVSITGSLAKSLAWIF